MSLLATLGRALGLPSEQTPSLDDEHDLLDHISSNLSGAALETAR